MSAANAGTLYVVATPIGNLEDITSRALRVLREADVVAAEDTRHTRRLLQHFGIGTRVVSYHDHSGPGRLASLLECMANGQTVALVSDAGSPAISDPGYPLLRDAVAQGTRVVSVPGPSAVIAALTVAALPTDRFAFLGFAPRKSGARRSLFAEYAERPETLVVYESPHRVLSLLEDAHAALGDRHAAVCRELTKLHEEARRGLLTELIAGQKRTPARGEIVVVIAGATREERREARRAERRSERDGERDSERGRDDADTA